MADPQKSLSETDDETQSDVESAIALCRARGGQMTPLRQLVLAELMMSDRPLGAYDLRDQVSTKSNRTISAPSIYRTLDFLCDLSVAARIESRNAYVACIHPEHDHACVFLVCETCGDATEIENAKVESLISNDAKRLGFNVTHRTVELSGICAPCQSTA